ncbi:MAG: nuclear transport factor 2 family protein [Actinobacteria bacterium]|nr:nuclear transport factor 2 family protein [Actinomycetota bacterium]
MDVDDLIEIEAIKRLKYRYVRCIDLKLWDEIAETFTEDASVSYDSGRWETSGRDAIVEMLRVGLGPEVLSSHTVHHPEIELTSPTTATGVWALQDFVFNRRLNTQLHGAAFYDDRYVKVDGAWRISFTGYTRTCELRNGLSPLWEP